jgi:polyphosphate kinase 2 (PPK2 family)
MIIKFFLNVSQEEQLKRLNERLEDPSKNWKFSEADLKEIGFREEYMKAYSDMLSHTSTRHAPWYVIPSDDKWYTRYVVSRIICMHLKRLKLHYPQISSENKAGIERAKEIFKEIKTGKP